MSPRANRIGVVSAGAWGTALAIIANRAGSEVTLWTRNVNVFDSISNRRTNEAYLPGIVIDPRIRVTDSLAQVCECDLLILALPSQHMRATCISLSDMLDASVPVVLATKGVERGSLALMSEVVSSILPHNPVAILTGPNFAGEAARGMPTATSVACQDERLAAQIIFSVGGKYFRPYHTDDVIGAQIGGAVKNVIAIACGIAMGCGFGENARAALVTRGLAEMTRLCLAKGGRQETMMGLSGVGDLMLTCGSTASRNLSFGMDLCHQKQPVKLTIEMWQKRLAEGITTSDSVSQLSRKLGISMPICKSVHDILNGDIVIEDAIHQLLERQFVAEVLHTSF